MADPHPGLAEIEGRPKALPEHVSDSRGWFRLSAIYCFLVFLLSWGIFLYAWATRNADWHFDLRGLLFEALVTCTLAGLCWLWWSGREADVGA